MKRATKKNIEHKIQALLKVGNWAEPAVSIYLRTISQLRYRTGQGQEEIPQRCEPVDQIIWPRNAAPGQASSWLGPIAKSLAKRYPLIYETIPQPYNDILIFHIMLKSGVIKVAIDVTDYTSRVEPTCVSDVDIYFKLQFNDQGYGSDRVCPGGFLAHGSAMYSYIPALRAWSLDPKHKKYDVYGRYGSQFGFETRAKAIDLLKNEPDFEFFGDMSRVLYARYLLEASRARICIDLPGNGPFCFRLVEYLALGCCVIAYPHRTRLNHRLSNGQNIIYCKEDMSDLVDLCKYYLSNETERNRIGQNAATFFDQYLHVDKLSEYYVETAVKFAQ